MKNLNHDGHKKSRCSDLQNNGLMISDQIPAIGRVNLLRMADCRRAVVLFARTTQHYRTPQTIHFGGQANLFDSGLRQAKAALASTKADLPSLPETKNLLLASQKQSFELPYTFSGEVF